MFSKSRTEPTTPLDAIAPLPEQPRAFTPPTPLPPQAVAPKAKPPASVLSADITIVGNVHSTGDIQVEGNIEGDVRAQLVTVGETATVKGEVIAEEIVVHGRVVGRVRGVKVRLSTSARVEGDIVHKTIAIESGAHFEGSVQRQEDPVGKAAQSQVQPQPQRASNVAAMTAAE